MIYKIFSQKMGEKWAKNGPKMGEKMGVFY
jgi:hypothetical protein